MQVLLLAGIQLILKAKQRLDARLGGQRLKLRVVKFDD
jgi:hypothetical protein